ncbi:peptidase M24 family protein [Anoxybacillus kestanbolensis]|uniref:Peptidase M24 family protein n=1 Tax=Anoxybacillus kestanbolensis TaxID=227476 RepID=A0A1V3FLR3_9BACL|nr:Xaa-Pro peptidase family protein [Anoxybacillus kestanbolensis]OOE02639.1 peptidase M24 family protein [Anoxybacillus kestanbolensis]QAV27517.1 aminopeptidase P family protein [Neobacillus thermocopriae]
MERISKLQQKLKETNASWAFITSTANVFYFSNFYSNPHERLLAIVIFPNDEPFLICPEMDANQAKQAGWPYAIVSYDDVHNPWRMLSNELNKRNVQTEQIGIEKSHVTVSRLEQLQSYFPHASFVDLTDTLHELRMIKDEKELQTLRQAAELADFAVDIGVHSIKEGRTELEIIATIEYELKKKGVRTMAFDTMVLVGTNSAHPHGVPGMNRIQSGDFVLFDLGIVLDGYCSDITRTVVFGQPTEEQKRIYNTVLQAQQAAIHTCQIGASIGSIDKAARSRIEQEGYGAYFPHRIGHGLGIDVHEYPSMNATNTMPLQAGMVFTIEPGIYVPSVGGVRIEDDVYMTEKGPLLLTTYPKELQII